MSDKILYDKFEPKNPDKCQMCKYKINRKQCWNCKYNKGNEIINIINEVKLGDGTVCTPAESVKWDDIKTLPIIVRALKMLVDFEVNTQKGIYQGKAGDYLFKGVNGELYPVNEIIFEQTYEIITTG